MSLVEEVREKGSVRVEWKKGNPVVNWAEHRNIFKILWNMVIVSVTTYAPIRLKNWIYRNFLGMKIGKNSGIAIGVKVDYIYPELIEIGDNVIVGQEATLLTHEYMQDHLRFGKVVIEDGACVGAHSIVRSGVKIGKNSVLGIGSMAHEDIDEGEVWVGRPMKKIKG